MEWQGIILHHSLTTDSGTMSWDAIRKYHMSKGWREIGYHAGIERINSSYEVLMGRPLDWFGSHTVGKNKTHLGLCFIGNYDEVEPPEQLLRVACERIIRPWMKAFSIPSSRIYGHRNFANKSCPGKKFNLVRIKDILNTLPEADI